MFGSHFTPCRPAIGNPRRVSSIFALWRSLRRRLRHLRGQATVMPTPGLRSRLRSLDWLDGTEGDTKAAADAPVVGLVPAAESRPAVRGVVVPTAAPAHPVRAP